MVPNQSAPAPQLVRGTRTWPQARGDKSPRAQRKHATVLFCDVKGSLNLCGSVELEQWWELMARLSEMVGEAADRYGGWVDRFTGDGAMAVFERSHDDANDALRACYAALWLRRSVPRTALSPHTRSGLELSLRFGMNSGEVLTGAWGHARSRQYTALGYEVGLAKRIEELARPDRILVSARSATLAGERMVFLDRGHIELHGARRPVRVLELAGRR